ncbi:peptidylprolyl isomerase [Actinomadura darangshiensis]|uniref:Peptidyl-prolyl cis-trans isomerase n=1 Tax=Actinomadura darangshiensis TaxID=705336 RepID=A0A4R5AS93_9ACTN|nr:peptidylprolyl isomerase [Actinomadura darangshiensis]TDD73282.1 peptidylprolyl isomerase [Actinomadura darangshiensis]
MRSRWSAPVLAAALTAALVPAGAAQASPVSRPGGGNEARCVFTPTPDNPAAKPVHPPRSKARAHGKVDVVLATNFGPVSIRMDRGNAPCAVHNFVSLSRQSFYDHTRCWRLTDSERLGVLQCGDIYAAEEGGPGYKFDDELTGEETYPRGTVAMGNWGPDTNGSQFFLVHSHANIPPAYTVLGKVTRGLSVLDRIVKGGIIPGPNDPGDGAPAKPVKIHRVFVRG